MEFGPRERRLHAVLSTEQDRGSVIVAAKKVLGIVQLRVGEELRFQQRVCWNDDSLAALAPNLAELPHRGPELFGLLDRPCVDGRIVVGQPLGCGERMEVVGGDL